MISPYHGVDWLAMACSIAAIVLLGNKNRVGFLFFLVANLSWIFIGYWSGSAAIILGNITFFVVNTRGFVRWGRDAATPPAPAIEKPA